MNRRAYVRTALFLVWLSASLLRCSECASEELVAAPTSTAQQRLSVLVLRDGGVLTGSISRQGERFVVSGTGSELQVKESDVLVACRSIEEGYDARRQQIVQPSADSHLALAEWCLRYGLYSQAARELVDARGFEPHHPRLALMERRIAAAGNSRPRDQAPVQLATSIDAAASDMTATPAAMLADELPNGVVERFTRKIQPILVNSCTTSGCHQPGGEQEFQLDRALLHGMGNRRSTMQNLAATLALVDREQPHVSPLLTVPRRTHGRMRAPIFGPRQAPAFTHLVDWVALVSRPPTTAPEATPDVDQMSTSTVLGNPDQSPEVQAAYGDSANDDNRRSKDSEVRRPTGRGPRYGAQLQLWRPKDAFDPEIFNRLQRVQESADAATPLAPADQP